MCQLSQPTIRPHNQMGPPRFNKNKLLLTSNQPPSLPSAGFLVFYDHRPPVLEIITTTSRCNHQSAPKRCIFLQLSEQSRLAKGNVQAPNKPEILMLNPPRASKKPRRHDRGPPLKIAALLRLNGALKKRRLEPRQERHVGLKFSGCALRNSPDLEIHIGFNKWCPKMPGS